MFHVPLGSGMMQRPEFLTPQRRHAAATRNAFFVGKLFSHKSLRIR
jgi:hypothetical protein